MGIAERQSSTRTKTAAAQLGNKPERGLVHGAKHMQLQLAPALRRPTPGKCRIIIAIALQQQVLPGVVNAGTLPAGALKRRRKHIAHPVHRSRPPGKPAHAPVIHRGASTSSQCNTQSCSGSARQVNSFTMVQLNAILLHSPLQPAAPRRYGNCRYDSSVGQS